MDVERMADDFFGKVPGFILPTDAAGNVVLGWIEVGGRRFEIDDIVVGRQGNLLTEWLILDNGQIVPGRTKSVGQG